MGPEIIIKVSDLFIFLFGFGIAFMLLLLMRAMFGNVGVVMPPPVTVSSPTNNGGCVPILVLIGGAIALLVLFGVS